MLAALLLVGGAITLLYIPLVSDVSQVLAIALGVANLTAAVLSGLMATAILWLAWTSWPPRAVR